MRTCWWMLVVGVLCSAACAPGEPRTLHVAPNGNDAWSGKPAEPNAARSDGPLATIEKALEAGRKARTVLPPDESIRIVLRGGTYVLKQPIELQPRDSRLTIEGVKGEEVVISGGRAIKGWKPWKGQILQADLSAAGLPDLEFRELYFNGKLMPWARVPNFDPKHPRTGGFLQNAGIVEAETKTKFRYREGDLRPEKWAHPERAWMMFHDKNNYETQYCPVKSIDSVNRVVEASKGVYVLAKGNPFYLCGLLEELDAPGEWCVDTD
ncbi:MAG: hypothetical protein FJ279_33005, partial [Planctomycetes bacterium]|nr:hypothetical protein [Planctomycetota bacterium]